MIAFNNQSQVEAEEVYYLKLEALWILTNLAYTDEMNTMQILASSQSGGNLASKDELVNDMKH